MNLLVAFLSALIATALAGVMARIAIGFVSVERAAGFGAFCVALGYVAGRYSYSGPLDARAVEAGVAAAGAILALAGLWAWLLKKAPGQGMAALDLALGIRLIGR
jgi:hypothetical protein